MLVLFYSWKTEKLRSIINLEKLQINQIELYVIFQVIDQEFLFFSPIKFYPEWLNSTSFLNIYKPSIILEPSKTPIFPSFMPFWCQIALHSWKRLTNWLPRLLSWFIYFKTINVLSEGKSPNFCQAGSKNSLLFSNYRSSKNWMKLRNE